MLFCLYASTNAALPDVFTPVSSPIGETPFDIQKALEHYAKPFIKDFEQDWQFFQSCCNDCFGVLSDHARLMLETFYTQKRALSKDDMQRFWESCKIGFASCASYDQGKILKQAAQNGEWDFVIDHLAKGNAVLDEVLKMAVNINQEAVDIIMSYLLATGNWSKLDENFACASPRVKTEIAGKAVKERKWHFYDKHKKDMPVLPKLSCVKREAEDMSDCDLPPRARPDFNEGEDD